MADGKRPTEAGLYQYDKKLFFLNRDPRFYRTFAFPGTQWKFLGTIDPTILKNCPYKNGQEYELQNYAWYNNTENLEAVDQYGYYADSLARNGKSIYVRKKSQDYGLGVTPMYVFESSSGFSRNGQPLIAMRYTEVLLNLAEAACGVNKLDEAYNILVRIRQRVGYTGDCGLNPEILTNRAKMFEAILYERMIELAYEGKRFDDCHRWMLFDGGVGQEAIGGSSWAPSGWGGNTCTYLGVTPLNNVKLHRLEIYFNPEEFMGEYDLNTDPFTALDIEKPKALTLNENFTTITDPETGNHTYANADVKALADFYRMYLLRKDIVTMNVTDEETGNLIDPIWDSKCYLMGLNSTDQENNPNVIQTVGWDSAFGGMGTFDPLAK